MTSEIKWRWRSGVLFAVAGMWIASAPWSAAAPYLPVTGPVPLRETAPHPTCLLSANPPLTLDSTNPRYRAGTAAPESTNAIVPPHPEPLPAAAPATAAAVAEERPFEYEPIVPHPAAADPPAAPAATNVVVVPVVVAPVPPPPMLTPQMFLPLLLGRPHPGGGRGDLTVVVPVDFQPPVPANPGKSSATYQSK